MSVSPRRIDSPNVRDEATVFLAVRRRSGLRASTRAFWRLCADNRDLRLERSSRGEVIAMAPAGSESGRFNAKLTMRLGNWSEADGTGEFFDSSTGFTLPDGSVFAPDASWIVRDRWLAIPRAARRRFAPICPEFVVEILSPSDTLKITRAKMVQYINQGVQLGWMLDSDSGIAEIYRPDRPVVTLDRPATLSGEDVLPGFVLDLKGILFD